MNGPYGAVLQTANIRRSATAFGNGHQTIPAELARLPRQLAAATTSHEPQACDSRCQQGQGRWKGDGGRGRGRARARHADVVKTNHEYRRTKCNASDADVRRIVLSNAPASPHALLPAAGQPRADAPQATIGPGSAGQPGPTALDGACVARHHRRPDRRAQHAPPCTCSASARCALDLPMPSR
jgi:hypothetical protein